jgi:hypothetical protein
VGVLEGESPDIYATPQDVVMATVAQADDVMQITGEPVGDSWITSQDAGYGFPRIYLTGNPVNRGKVLRVLGTKLSN